MPFTFEELFPKPYFTDFAPNENLKTSFLGLKYHFQYSEKYLTQKIKKLLKTYLKNENLQISFFFTGRNALLNLLKALNLKKEDEILIQGFTCSTVILPILKLKIRPVFVDIEEKTFSIDPKDLIQKITPKSRLLILQHTYGFTPEKRAKILSIAQKTNLFLIEDIAHTIKPISFDYDPQKQFFLLSFGRSKALSSVLGGAIVYKNDKIGERLKKIQQKLKKPDHKMLFKITTYKFITSLIKKTYVWKIGKAALKICKNLFPPEITEKEKNGIFDEKYDLGYSKLQKAFLLAQLEKYDKISKQRINKANKILKKIPDHYLPKKLKNQKITSPIIRLPIFYPDPDRLIKKLKQKNIFLGRWYYQPIIGIKNAEKLGYQKNSCPKAEKVGKRIITIGI